MRNLPAQAVIQANKINPESAWILLLEVKVKSSDVPIEPIRICRNTENLTWNNQEWVAYPFSIGDNKADNKGSLPTLTVEIDNTTKQYDYWLEHTKGGTDSEVVIYVVRVEDFNNRQVVGADIEEHFTIKHTSNSRGRITFTLGNSYNTRSRRPLRRYMKNTCPFVYKSIECSCQATIRDDEGNEITCNHTLSDCRLRNNSKRFGGYPALLQGGLFVE